MSSARPTFFPPTPKSRRYTPPAAPFEHYQNVQKITGLSRAPCVVQPTAHGVDNRAILDAIAIDAINGAMVGIANIDATTSDAELDPGVDGRRHPGRTLSG